MVRGRRGRAITSETEIDCNSPKHKNKKLEFRGKLSHAIVSPSSITKEKDQIITDFFQVVQVHDLEKLNNISCIESHESLINELQHQNGIKESNQLTTIENIDKKATTPHRIELCHDTSKKNKKESVKRRLDPDVKGANHTLTEYFPVRRSVRKTYRTVLEEKQASLEQCVRREEEEGLKIHSFSGKGRGIVATKSFSRGDFVVEYRGELVNRNEARRRESKYAQDENTGCYMYYFKHKSKQYCIDATAESRYLGRLVNHSRNGNLISRIVQVDGLPHLVLVAKTDISKEEEVTYDYGDRSSESLKYHPWLAS